MRIILLSDWRSLGVQMERKIVLMVRAGAQATTR